MRVSPWHRRAAIALMAVGTAVAVPCGIASAVSTKNGLRIEGSASAPAAFQVTLGSGDWEIYERTGTFSSSSAGLFSFSDSNDQPPDISVDNIRVQDSSGTVLPLASRYGGHSIDSYNTGSRIYTGVASFDARHGGRYSIVVDSPSPDTVIIARPPLAALTRSLPIIAIAAVGVAALVAGLVLFILDVDRRRRVRHALGGGSQTSILWGGPSTNQWTPQTRVEPTGPPPPWPPSSPAP